MDYNVTTKPNTDSSNLFSANVNIVFAPTDFVWLGLALLSPVLIFFLLKLLTKTR